MKFFTIIFFSILTCFFSCDFSLKPEVLDKLYNEENLMSQVYSIDIHKDTTLVGESGTIIKIYANSFTLLDGSDSSLSNIEIELKEALEPVDFVLGNLTTVSDNKLLQSGGMLYINAEANGKRLKIKDDKEIGVIMPASSYDEEMELFRGYRSWDGSMVWNQSRERVLNSELKRIEQSFITITYGAIKLFPDNDSLLDAYLFDPVRKVGDKTKIRGLDVEVLKIEKNLVALRESSNGLFIPDVITNKGQNGYVRDFNTNYIFSSRKLGWTNIDKFFDDPDSREINMIVKVDNEQEFNHVFTSLVLPDLSSYVSGYQKNDDSYGFTQDDDEKMKLPIGQEAIIMATAYKGDNPYFSMKKVLIEDNMDINMTLSETTPDDLKNILKENI